MCSKRKRFKRKSLIEKEEFDWKKIMILFEREEFFPKWRMIGLKGESVFKRLVRGKRKGFWWNSSIKKDVKKHMKKGGVE